MALSWYGSEKKNSQPAPVTLPKVSLPDLGVEDEAREAEARVSQNKTIRAGRDCWENVGKANGFDSWEKIGAALCIGKQHALKSTGANRAWGSAYSKEFSLWMKTHGFGAMRKSLRSNAIELHENIIAIQEWRATLTEQDRRRLQGPQHTLRRWRAETGQAEARVNRDAVKAAQAAWSRFVSCVQALPPDQAALLWRAVQNQATSALVNIPG